MNLVIEIIAYLCEFATQILCIHSFLGKKIRINVKLISIGVINAGILLLINNSNIPNIFTLLAHIIVFIYILLEFKLKLVHSVILMLFNVLLSGALQLLVVFPITMLPVEIKNGSIIGFIVNLVSLIIMLIVSRFIKLNEIYAKTIKWDKTIIRVLFLIFVLFSYLLVRYKLESQMIVMAYLISALLIVILIGIVLTWQKDRYEIKQKSLELYMHELYGKTFEGMIENIRIRQHDFKNQLAAIYGMHLTADNFEDLVESQKEYCDYLMSESRYDSILTKCNDKILAGFLYTKFTEWEKKGIEFQFDILLKDGMCKLATYELIELSGILIDNASEYVLSNDVCKRIEFVLRDSDKGVIVICRNQSQFIPMETINKFFKKGYSTKGKDRGLGLYNTKKLLEGKGEIIVSNQIVDNENYIEFKVDIDR